MSEMLIYEGKFSNGEVKIVLEKEKKLLKTVAHGVLSGKDMQGWLEALSRELKSHDKNELLYLHDGTGTDMKIFNADQTKMANEAIKYISMNAKKSAVVYTSFVHQKSHAASVGGELPGTKWLLA